MNVTFGPKGILQIDDAKLIYRNFEGRGDKYNREGDRNFAIIITDGEVLERGSKKPRFVDAQEMADILMADTNQYGNGWNVKIKPPRDEDEAPFIFMTIKVKFSDFGPRVMLKSGDRPVDLDEESIGCLDRIDILTADLDIRPYDDEFNGKSFRSAYLQAAHIEQEVNRFEARYSDYGIDR